MTVSGSDPFFGNEFYPFLTENFVIIWQKVEPKSQFLAVGDKLLKSDNGRITVEINRNGENKGSTLMIALADSSDQGHYICQLGSNDKKEIKHTVKVRGK